MFFPLTITNSHCISHRGQFCIFLLYWKHCLIQLLFQMLWYNLLNKMCICIVIARSFSLHQPKLCDGLEFDWRCVVSNSGSVEPLCWWNYTNSEGWWEPGRVPSLRFPCHFTSVAEAVFGSGYCTILQEHQLVWVLGL